MTSPFFLRSLSASSRLRPSKQRSKVSFAHVPSTWVKKTVCFTPLPQSFRQALLRCRRHMHYNPRWCTHNRSSSVPSESRRRRQVELCHCHYRQHMNRHPFMIPIQPIHARRCPQGSRAPSLSRLVRSARSLSEQSFRKPRDSS